MPIDLSAVDPAWSWSAYESSAERPWDRHLAAHLFRRAGFGATSRELAEAEQQSPDEIVDRLAGVHSASSDFTAGSDRFAATILATGDPKQLSAWWVYVLLQTPQPLVERSTLFWHGHFATSADKVRDADAMYAQNRLLREQALGDFAQLTHAIARDPAMLVYLDSATNRKAHPNENFARELMELFCLGEGNYSEKDIQELARCFTGWEVRQGKFRFNRFQHDDGTKSILGQSGEFPDDEAIDVVLAQPAAPRFIARKLVRYFVFDEPQINDALIQPLADELSEHHWDIGRIVRRILTSNLFYSDFAVGRKIRSPVDFLIGLLRSLDGTANAHELAQDLVRLGQGLFYPPNVKGWDGGRTWINSATLLDRANAAGRLLRDSKTRFGGQDLAEYMQSSGATTAAAVVDQLAETLLAVPLSPRARDRLIAFHNQTSGDRNRRIVETIHALCTLPEFQLC